MIEDLRRLLASEKKISVADVPEIWIARTVANGSVVRFIDVVDGGFDVIVGEGGSGEFKLSFRPGRAGVALVVSAYDPFA